MVRLTLQVFLASVGAIAILLAAAYAYLEMQAPRADHPEIYLQLGHYRRVSSVAFAPDGKTLASSSDDNSIRLWDPATGMVLATLAGHTSSVSSVAFAPDGKTLASGSGDNSIKLWDSTTGMERATLTGHTSAVLSVAFAADGRTLASGSFDNSIKLWDLATGMERATLLGHTGAVSGVAFAPDGKTLASGSNDGSVRLWDPVTGSMRTMLAALTFAVSSVAFAPDGRTLASGSKDNSIKLWEPATGSLRATLTGHTSVVLCVAFAPDGTTIATGSDDNTIKLWDAASGMLRATLPGHTSAVYGVAFAPDGRTLASGSLDNSVILWNPATAMVRSTLPGLTNTVRAVALARDGRTLASVSSDGIELWDAATGTLRATLSGHTGAISSVAFAPDGRRLASGSFDNTINLWDPDKGTPVLKLDQKSAVSAVAFSPNGKVLASGGDDDHIYLWDPTDGTLLAKLLESHKGGVSSVAFSPDGGMLASGGSFENAVKLWDPAYGTPLATLSDHTGAISSVAFAPDGETLASGSNDKSIKLWDVAARTLRATLSGHTSAVLSVAFSPDRNMLASSSKDNTINLWDLAVGMRRTTLSADASHVQSLAFGPDWQLAAALGDGSVELWDVQRPRLHSVLLAAEGQQFITLYPSALRYRTSRPRNETEPAAVRFNRKLNNAYPLHYYQDSLRLGEGERFPAHNGPEPGRAIQPRPVRQAWDRWPNKRAWLAGGVLVYTALLAAAVMLLKRTNPLTVAQQFFELALQRKVDTTSLPAVDMRVANQGQPGWLAGRLPLGALREIVLASQAAAVQRFWLLAPKAKGQADAAKLYLVYSNDAPNLAQVALLRNAAGAQIVPVSTSAMKRALGERADVFETLRKLEEPFVVRADPYDEQSPVESEVLFFGRHKQIATISQALLQGQHIGLFGLRKVGKTSMLIRLRERLAAHPVVSIDCQGYAIVAVDLYAVILKRLANQLAVLGVAHASPEPTTSASDFRRDFVAMFDQISRRVAGARIVLMFDELDKFLPDRRDAGQVVALKEYVKLFRTLRSLAQEYRSLSILAVAYRPDINRQNLLSDIAGENPMFMAYQEEYLGFLDATDMASMVREIGRLRSIDWEDAALERLYELAGGHPLLSRQLASDACLRGERQHVTLADVQNVQRSIEAHFGGHRVGNYLDESIWRMLRESERNLLQRIAATPEIPLAALVADDRDNAFANLRQFGLLKVTNETVSVRGSLLVSWINGNA